MFASSRIILVVLVVSSVKIEHSISETYTSTCLFPPLVEVNSVDVKIFLIKPNNERILLNTSGAENLLNPSFPTKIIIHGWLVNSRYPSIETAAFNYHQKGNYNVLAVDWSVFSATFDYGEAVAATQPVGQIVGDFIIALNQKTSLSFSTIHLIGHSLGAHICGFAGKRVTSIGGNLVDRITGLDAAAPLFEIPLLNKPREPSCRLAKTDAVFVELVHTSLFFGVMSPLGKVDFYVNGQVAQPGCSPLAKGELLASCSHTKAWVYFTNAIVNSRLYEAVSCNSEANFYGGLCYNNSKTYMSEEVDRNASGRYYVTITKG